jgi:hypothetical protein
MKDDDDIQDYISNREATNIRNATLEEVAKKFEAMKNFGDTSASFAVFVREMKKEQFSNAKTQTA